MSGPETAETLVDLLRVGGSDGGPAEEIAGQGRAGHEGHDPQEATHAQILQEKGESFRNGGRSVLDRGGGVLERIGRRVRPDSPLLWDGLLTVPPPPTAGLPVPTEAGDLRSKAVARSGDRATTRVR